MPIRTFTNREWLIDVEFEKGRAIGFSVRGREAPLSRKEWNSFVQFVNNIDAEIIETEDL